MQQTDFEEILEAMDGLPVTVRLLDPPLHEFLPSVEELRIKEATHGPRPTRRRQLLAAAESWAEHNPMIGTRGVRLGVIKPGLYAMQVRALLEAAADAAQAGQEPDRRDHDPAHRHPRGAAPRPRLGRRTRSTRPSKGMQQEARRSRSAR